MKANQLVRLGVPRGPAMKAAFALLKTLAATGAGRKAIEARIRAITAAPHDHEDDPQAGAFATALTEQLRQRASFRPRETAAPYRQWGTDLERRSVEQMENACALPIAVRGALMPDAHLGYGLPIGGVLATRNAVIPYAVGVDIACRMKMTVLDLPPTILDEDTRALQKAIADETRFGVGCRFKKRRRQHAVLDDDWAVTDITAKLRDKAWAQLGTSGSGNHFVEFGTLTLDRPELGLEAGTYLALLSHSGSRGAGATVADHYSKLAQKLHPELPKELTHLAWLDLGSPEGQAYWEAMQLMGRYAAANHDCIHRHIAKALGVDVLLDVENHHNFAWKEQHDGREVVVHRKGATPAGKGVLGIIPGSMGTHAFLVRGKGDESSLRSASHGAGRRMSRTQAKKRFRWPDVQRFLKARRVKLISAGLDEVPMAYKDIDEVMAAQTDLVETVARFQPRLVKMAP